jgi:hypothetical protein
MDWATEFIRLLREAEKRKAELQEHKRREAILESVRRAARGKVIKQESDKIELEPARPLPPRPYKKRPKSKRSKAVLTTRRQKVFERDHYTCQICGRRFPEQHLVPNHIDHNIQHNSMDNLETTCAGCNMQEGMIYAKLLRKAGPRDQITEEKRLKIVEEARRIAREQAPSKDWRSGWHRSNSK